MLGRGSAFIAVVLTCLFLAAAGAPAQTVDANWTGAGVDADWFRPSNWDSGLAPDGNTLVIFPVATPLLSPNLGGLTGAIHTVDLRADGYDITNGVLEVGTGILQSGVGTNTISAQITGADIGITVSGGVLRLTGDNSGIVTGTTGSVATVASGATLVLLHETALGDGADGARIDLTGGTLILGEAGRPVFSQDIGDDVTAGTGYSYDPATGEYAVTGNGHDIWDNADDFRFVYTPLSGDMDIQAHIASVTGNDSQGWRKAGIMIRETLDDGSVHAFMALTPGSGHPSTMQWRPATDGGSSSLHDPVEGPMPPGWVRLVREGDTFTGYWSTDGINWTERHSETVTMAADAYVGLAVTSHDAGVLTTAVFDNVNIGFADPLPTGYNVNVLNSSTIQVGREAPAALGSLTIERGRSLDLDGSISFTGTQITGLVAGDVTFNTVTADTRSALGGVDDGGVATRIVKGGPGELVLDPVPAANLADSTFRIDGGKVLASIAGANTSLGGRPVELAGGALSLGAAVVETTLTDDALTYLSMDRDLIDATGGGIDGSAGGQANINGGAAKLGPGGVALDGDDDYVDFGDVDAMDRPDAFSVSIWFNRLVDKSGTSIDTNHQVNNVLFAQSSSSGNDNFEVGTEGDEIEVYFDSGGGSETTTVRVAPTGGISNGEWHHLVVTFDRNETATGELKAYLDGTLAQAWDQFNDQIADSPTAHFTMGIARTDGSQQMWGEVEGYLDEAGVWLRGLTSAEVTELYNGGAGFNPFAPVVAQYGNAIEVTASSELELLDGGLFEVGALTIGSGVLSVTGEEGTILLTDGLAAGPGGGIDVADGVTVLPRRYDDGGATLTFEKTGGGMLFFDDLAATTADAGTTFRLGGGSVAIYCTETTSTLPNAEFLLDGGSLLLTSVDGNDFTLGNLLSVAGGGGGIEARVLGDGLPGVNAVIAGPVEVPDGATLSFTTADDYSIRLDGDISGDGGLAVSGTVDANGAINVDGHVSIDGDLVGADSIFADSFTVNGTANVDDYVDVTLANLNGDVTIGGELYCVASLNVSGGDSTVGGPVSVDDVLTITGGSLHGQGMVEVFTSVDANGGALTADGLLITPVLNVDGAAVTAAGGIDDTVIEAIAVSAGELNLPNTGLTVPLLTATGGAANVSGDLSADELRIVGGTLTVGGRLSVDHTGPDDSSNFTLDDGGRLIVSDPNALADMPNFTVANTTAPGWLSLDGTGMNVLPVITVASGALLDGNTTGAVFAGASIYDANTMPDVNVVLHDGAVFGGTLAPNTFDLGSLALDDANGDRLMRAIIGGDDGEDIKLGDDAADSDDIYRAAAFGPWTVGRFVGTIEEGTLGQGLEIDLNGRTDVEIELLARFKTTNTDTGVNFVGAGKVRFTNTPLPSGWDVITRTGPDDGSMINEVILELDAASVYDGKTIKASNGIVQLNSNEALNADGTLTLLDGASLIFDDEDDSASGNKPSRGTINVGAGAMVYVRHTGKFAADATYNWEPGAILAFRCQNVDKDADNWPTNVHFVFAHNTGCDAWPEPGFTVSDGAYMIARAGANAKFDEGIGARAAAGAQPGDTVGVAAPTDTDGSRRYFNFDDPFDLRFEFDGNTHALNLIIGSDEPMTTIVDNYDANRIVLPMTGYVRPRRTTIVGDVHVRSGEFLIDIDDAEATQDGFGDVFRAGTIYGYNDDADIRFERADNFNNADVFGDGETRSVLGKIVWRGDEVYVDEDEYFGSALVDGTFAEEIVVGPKARIVMRMTATDEVAKPWGSDFSGDGNCRIITQPFVIEATDANWAYNYNLRTIRNEGSGNNHYFFPDITLQEGAVLGMRAQNTTNFVNLLFDGNAGTTLHVTAQENGDDFHVLDAVSSGGDRVWTVGESAQGLVNHNLLGKLGDANGAFLINAVAGRIVMDYSATYAPGTVVEMRGGGFGFKVPYQDDDGIVQPTVLEITDIPFTVYDDGLPTSIDGVLAFDRQQATAGPDERVEGIVVFRDVTIEAGARLQLDKVDQALAVVDLKLESAAYIDENDNTSNWFLGDVTIVGGGGATLTFEGGTDSTRIRRMIGTLPPDLTLVYDAAPTVVWTNQDDGLNLRGLDLGYDPNGFRLNGATFHMLRGGGPTIDREYEGTLLFQGDTGDGAGPKILLATSGGSWGDNLRIGIGEPNTLHRGDDTQASVLEIRVDESSTPFTSTYNNELRVMPDSYAWLASRTVSGTGNSAGQVAVPNLSMAGGSTLFLAEDNGIAITVGGALTGDAAIGADESDKAFLGDFSGSHTLTVFGSDPAVFAGGQGNLQVLGAISTEGLTIEMQTNEDGSPRFLRFLSGSSLTSDEVTLDSNGLSGVEFQAGSTVNVGRLTFNSGAFRVAGGVAVVTGNAEFNMPMTLRDVDLTLSAGAVNDALTVETALGGSPDWTVNGPKGELIVAGLDAAGAGSYALSGGRLTALIDGDADVAAPLAVYGESQLHVDRQSDAGGTGKTISFGQLVLGFSTPDPVLSVTSANGYGVAFTDTVVDTGNIGIVDVVSAGTVVDLGPAEIRGTDILEIDANDGSTVKVGPLTGGAGTVLQFGTSYVGSGRPSGTIELSDSTAWGGEVCIDHGWLRLDAALTGYPSIDVKGGIDIAANDIALGDYMAVNVKLSESMANVVAPASYDVGAGAVPGQLVLNAPAIDASFVQSDGLSGTQTMRLVEDVGDLYGWEAAVWSAYDGAVYNANIEMVGDIQFGEAGGLGTNFEMAGEIMGAGDAVKVGPETVIFSGSNTYDGNTLVQEGVLVMRNLFAFGDDENNTIELLGGTLRVEVADANFSPVAAPSYRLTMDSNSTLELAANGANLADVVVGDGTLMLSASMQGATPPTEPITGTLRINTPEVHGDYAVALNGTIQADVSSLVHSVADVADSPRFVVADGETLEIDGAVTLGGDRTWDVVAGTVNYSGGITIGAELTKAGAGTLVLGGSNSIDALRTQAGSGGTVVVATAASAPTSALVEAGSVYSAAMADHTYGEVSALSTGVLALPTGVVVESTTTIDLSGSTGLSLGALGGATFRGTLIPGTDGTERHYYLGGGGGELRLESVLADHDGNTSVHFGWDTANDPVPAGTAVVAANHTVTGDVDVYMPVTYATGTTPFEGVDPAADRWITVHPGGLLDLNSTAARQDNIRSLGGSIANTGGELSAAAIQAIWQTGDYIIGSDAGGATTYADGGFVRVNANLIKMGTDTAILGAPGVAGASQNAYGSDMDGMGAPGSTIVQGGVLVVGDTSSLGGGKTLDIQDGAAVNVTASGAWDGMVQLAGTLNIAAGVTLDLSAAGVGLILPDDPNAVVAFTGGGTLDLGGLDGSTIDGNGMVEIRDGGTLRARVSGPSAVRPFVLPEGATVELSWDGSPERQIGVVYPDANVRIVATANSGTSGVHSNAGEVLDLRVDGAAWLADPDAVLSPTKPYRIYVSDAGQGFFGMRYSTSHPEDLQQILTPTVADGNTLYHPVAYIEKTGPGDFYTGRTLFTNDADGGKPYWLIREGDVGLIHNGTVPDALGATAAEWLASLKHPRIAAKHLEGIEVSSGASLSWYGDIGFLPDTLWRTPENAHEDGNGWNPGEFLFEDGAGLYGRVRNGVTRTSFEPRLLTLGFRDGADVYVAYPTIQATAGTPTLRLGGDIDLRSGVDANTLNPFGSTYHAVIDRPGRVQFTGDLPGAKPIDNFETLTIERGTAVISLSHTVLTETTIEPGGTLELNSGGVLTYPGTVHNEGLVHAASGDNDMSAIHMTSTVGSAITPNSLAGSYHGDYDVQQFHDPSVRDFLPAFESLTDPDGDSATLNSVEEFLIAESPEVQQLLTVDLNFASTSGNPLGGAGVTVPGGNDDLVAFWEGQIHAPNTGTYAFSTESDDGSFMAIDGEIVADNNEFQGMLERGGTVELEAGWHDVLMGFYEGGGAAGFIARWASVDANIPRSVIPITAFRTVVPLGRIQVDPAASLTLGSFTDMGDVLVQGDMSILADSTTDGLTIAASGTLDLGANTLDANVGTVLGTLRGSGATASFGTLTLDGAPTIDLAGGSVNADHAVLATSLAFTPADLATFHFDTMTVRSGTTIVEPASTLHANTVRVASTLSLNGGDPAIGALVVEDGGTVELNDGTYAQTTAVTDSGLVRAATGLVDLSGTVINGGLAPTVPPTVGLEGHYTFDDPANLAGDFAGADHSGTIVGDPEYDAGGVIGGALRMDSNDALVNFDAAIGDASAEDFWHPANTTRTFSAWFNQTDSNGPQMLIDEGGSTNGFGVMLDDGVLKARVKGGTPFANLEGPAVGPGWHQVVLLWDSPDFKLYLDGELVDEVTDALDGGPVPDHSNQPSIGTAGQSAFNNLTSSGAMGALVGLVDDVRVYTGALRESEILGGLFGETYWMGDIQVDANVTMRLGGFSQVHSVTPQGSLEVLGGMNTATRLTIPDGGTMSLADGASLDVGSGAVAGSLAGTGAGSMKFGDLAVPAGGSLSLGDKSLDAASATVAGSLVGSGAGTVTFGDVRIEGAAPVVDLGGAPLEADAATIAVDGFAFDGALAGRFGTLNMSGPVSVAIEQTGDVQADTVNIDSKQTLVLRGGATDIQTINNDNVLHAESGVNDLSGTVIVGAVGVVPQPGSVEVRYAFEGNADDASGNARTGAVTGAIFVPDGAVGGALQFDGTDDLVTVTGWTGILGTTPRSLSAWVKTTKTDAGIMNWGTNTAGQKWTFRTQTSNGQAGAIRVEVNGGYQVGDVNVCDDEWHHVAAVFPDGGTNVTDMLLYLDGELLGISANQGQAIDTVANVDVRIGGDYNTAHFWDGLIDEVGIWSTALTAEEIRALAGWRGGYVQVDAGATLKVKGFSDLGTIAVDGLLELGEAGGSCTKVEIGPAGVVEIGDNELVIAGQPLADLLGDIRSAYSGGAWDGPGIRSSVAAAQPDDIGIAAVAGADGVTLKAALIGDADLSEEVGREDFLALRSSFDGPADWGGGDFNYDGESNYVDYILLKRNMGRTYSGGGGGVPEPATLSLVALGLLAVVRRRRRRR